MTQTLTHPSAILGHLLQERLAWIREAARFFTKGEDSNCRYCQGRASGLNDAIVAMGGEAIPLAVSCYLPEVTA